MKTLRKTALISLALLMTACSNQQASVSLTTEPTASAVTYVPPKTSGYVSVNLAELRIRQMVMHMTRMTGRLHLVHCLFLLQLGCRMRLFIMTTMTIPRTILEYSR